MARAFVALGWTWPLEKIGIGGRPASPSRSGSTPWRSAHHDRAVASAVKLAIVAPVVKTPPHLDGRPKRSSSHRMDVASSCPPSGDDAHENAFWSTADASQSAASAAGVAPPVTKWKKRGPAEACAPSRPATRRAITSSAGAPSSGSGPAKERAVVSVVAVRTGRSGNERR